MEKKNTQAKEEVEGRVSEEANVANAHDGVVDMTCFSKCSIMQKAGGTGDS